MFELGTVFIKTFSALKKHHVSDMAAALSFYSLFAFAPVILVMLSLTRLFFVDIVTQQKLFMEVQLLLGTQIADVVQNIIKIILTDPDIDNFAYWAGIAGLCLGASSIFVQLERSVHTLWNIDSNPNPSIKTRVKQRLSSLVLLIITSILLLIILLSNLFVSIFTLTFIKALEWPIMFNTFTQTGVLFLSVMLLFALIFRYVPRGKIAWQDIIVGSGLTAILYMLGKYVLELYFHYATIGSLFGAAGSLIIFLLWLYYTSLIFFFGAQFTYIYAQQLGSGVNLPKHK